MQRKKKTKDVYLSRSLLPLFRVCSLSLSLQTSEHTHRRSERTCAREWSSDGGTSSSFFSVKVNALKEPTKLSQKNFLRDFSSETCPWIRHDEPLGYSSAPIIATDQAIYRDGAVIHFEERCAAKNNFETKKFTFSISLHNTVVLGWAIYLFL